MAPKCKARARKSPAKVGDSLAAASGYHEVLQRLRATFEESLKQDNDDPQTMIDRLKAERAAAQQVVKEKTNELRNLMRKVARLQAKGKQMSDNGLLLEFRRRQLHKEKSEKKKLARQNAMALADEQSG